LGGAATAAVTFFGAVVAGFGESLLPLGGALPRVPPGLLVVGRPLTTRDAVVATCLDPLASRCHCAEIEWNDLRFLGWTR
jgi:hypothetical protein